jgi:hypothetical protein
MNKDFLIGVLIGVLILIVFQTTDIGSLIKRDPAPVISVAPTQAVQVVPVGTPYAIQTMNAVAAEMVQQQAQPVQVQPAQPVYVEQVNVTSTPGPTLNEYMGDPSGGNAFGGSVTLVP